MLQVQLHIDIEEAVTLFTLRLGIKQGHLCGAKWLMWFCLDMKSAERQMSLLGGGPGSGVETWLRQRGTFLITDCVPILDSTAFCSREHLPSA